MRRFVVALSLALTACQAFLVLERAPREGAPDASRPADASDGAALPAEAAGADDVGAPPPPPNDGGELLDGAVDPFCSRVRKDDKGDGYTTAYCSSAPSVATGSGLASQGTGKFTVDITEGHANPPSLIATPPGASTPAGAVAEVLVDPGADLSKLRVHLSARTRTSTAGGVSLLTVKTSSGVLSLSVDETGQVGIVTDMGQPVATDVLTAYAWHAYELVVDGSAILFRSDDGGLSGTPAQSIPLTGTVVVEVGSVGPSDAFPEVAIDDLAVSFKP